MIALITAALEGLASIPKILDFIKSLELEARLSKIEATQAKIKSAYDLLNQAKTAEEKANAADAIAHAFNDF